jgi:hypothetical protein
LNENQFSEYYLRIELGRVHKKIKMKKLIVALTVLIGTTSFSQKPVNVYSIVKERHEISWYETQETLWQKEIDQNKSNGNAWYNKYMAVRAIRNLTENEEEKSKHSENLDIVANQAFKSCPNSFEGNFLMYKNFGHLQDETDFFKHLEKAFEISPNDPRTFVDFMVHYDIVRDQENFHKFANKFFKANEISGSIYNWAYNLLSEVDENAIVFTAGDNDTFSFWAMQEAKDFRTDVTIINTSLLLVDDYRFKVLAELGIETPEKHFDKCKTIEEQETLKKEIFTKIFNSNKFPVYVSSTAAFQFEEDFGENLYLTGLAYQYCKNKIDNIALIRRNYEKRYLLDHLTMTFAFNIGDNVSDRMNATYLAGFVKLYKHYRDCEETEQMKTLEKYLVEISKKTDQYEDIKKLIAG